jgi:deoxyribodipyrimidine photolyase
LRLYPPGTTSGSVALRAHHVPDQADDQRQHGAAGAAADQLGDQRADVEAGAGRRCSSAVAYTRDQLENARMHDRYWNAAMLEMRATGFMHNYMRMYWGKKILERSADPEAGFRTTLHLNNKYFLDGRDANS